MVRFASIYFPCVRFVYVTPRAKKPKYRQHRTAPAARTRTATPDRETRKNGTPGPARGLRLRLGVRWIDVRRRESISEETGKRETRTRRTLDGTGRARWPPLERGVVRSDGLR